MVTIGYFLPLLFVVRIFHFDLRKVEQLKEVENSHYNRDTNFAGVATNTNGGVCLSPQTSQFVFVAETADMVIGQEFGNLLLMGSVMKLRCKIAKIV